MKAVIQRVSKSTVVVDGRLIAAIGKGLLVLVGIEKGDTEDDAMLIARKVSKLRIFPDKDQKMNFSVKDINGEVLAVSQFTLLGDLRKGSRPNFTDSEEPKRAEELFNKMVEYLSFFSIPVKTGIFGKYMQVELVNDGPVTILFDSRRI